MDSNEKSDQDINAQAEVGAQPGNAPDLSTTRVRIYGGSENGCVRHRARYKNHVWSCDFVTDRTEDGRQLRLLVVIDECKNTRQIRTREWIYTRNGKQASGNGLGHPENQPEKPSDQADVPSTMKKILALIDVDWSMLTQENVRAVGALGRRGHRPARG